VGRDVAPHPQEKQVHGRERARLASFPEHGRGRTFARQRLRCQKQPSLGTPENVPATRTPAQEISHGVHDVACSEDDRTRSAGGAAAALRPTSRRGAASRGGTPAGGGTSARTNCTTQVRRACARPPPPPVRYANINAVTRVVGTGRWRAAGGGRRAAGGGVLWPLRLCARRLGCGGVASAQGCRGWRQYDCAFYLVCFVIAAQRQLPLHAAVQLRVQVLLPHRADNEDVHPRGGEARPHAAC
jgi:hypothetical protein